MSDDVALRVVDDRNRSRNWSRAPSSLGVRLQSFETRVAPSGNAREKGEAVDLHPDDIGCVVGPWACIAVSPVPLVSDAPAWCASVVLGLRRNAVDIPWNTSVGIGQVVSGRWCWRQGWRLPVP